MSLFSSSGLTSMSASVPHPHTTLGSRPGQLRSLVIGAITALASLPAGANAAFLVPTCMSPRKQMLEKIRTGRVKLFDYEFEKPEYEKWHDDKEVVLAAVKKSSRAFPAASERLRGDEDVVRAAVQRTGRGDRLLKYVTSEYLKNDKEIVLTAVERDSYAMEYASDNLRGDVDVVMAAVRKANVLEHASAKMRERKDVVLAAVSRDGRALKHASWRLQMDKEVVLAAVKQIGCAFKFASMELRKDEQFVLEALKQNPRAYGYASKELREKEKFQNNNVVKACKQQIKELICESLVYMGGNGDALLDARDDKEIVLFAMKYRGSLLGCACKELQNDREVVSAAVRQDSDALRYASIRLQQELKN